jgi:ketosteroid isomerase-like protein
LALRRDLRHTQAMSLRRRPLLACLTVPCLGSAAEPAATGAAQPTPHDQVWAAELAFAQAMAQRDLNGFAAKVAQEAVFFSGTRALRGRAEVLLAWAAYFKDPEPPFSWAPDQVEVLASGRLALSTGPVRNPQGDIMARFQSVWRREEDGQWRVVFDKGGPPSPGP